MRVKVNDGKTKDVAITDVTPKTTLYRATNNICIIALLRCASLTAKRANAYPFPVSKNSAKSPLKTAFWTHWKNRVTRLPYCTTPTSTSRRKPRKSGTNRRTAESRRGKSRRRCKGKGRSRGESQSRGKSGVKGWNFGGIESGGSYPGGTRQRNQSRGQTRSEKVTEY